jgi:hypothetical protein
MPDVLLVMFLLSILVLLVGGAVTGWVLNIVKLAGAAEAGGPTVLLVLRTVGIFLAPIGVVLGYVN